MAKEMNVFFSIRVVRAMDREDATDEVENNNFDENHPLCDRVLTKEELLKELNKK